jgi:hypothetical protein
MRRDYSEDIDRDGNKAYELNVEKWTQGETEIS